MFFVSIKKVPIFLTNLLHLRRILDDYGGISGLRCNYDKTCILKVGPDPAPDLNLHGFSLSDSITLLGMEVKSTLTNEDAIFEGLKEKILGIIRFWDLFRLSLPGRISVIKTLLLPQLNYLGSILNPSTRLLAEIQSIIDSFALKNLRVAESRLYLPPKLGGLGLVRLEAYSWIVSVVKKNIDNWRYDLKKLAPDGDISRIRNSDVNKTRHPILNNLVMSFSKLVGAHSKINGNYKIAYIFENSAFTWGENNQMLDRSFFGAKFFLRYREKIRKLRLIDCYNGDNFKTIREFSEMGLPLQMNIWLCLRGR
jgi:hypothetical protein